MNDTFKTIASEGEGYYTEKRSKFLAFAHHVESVDEVKDIIAAYRKKYYDARHVCYAYMLGAERTVFRSNDDGEPSSTAGKPILGQINSNELTDILIVVVRYYGGVNLGTSGLIVAYREAAADAISKCRIEERMVEDIITYDARFCFVINGVRYGPEENYKEVVFGDALSNPLVESNNYYTIMTGITVNMGVAFDKDGKAYVYCCHVGYNGEPYYNSDKNNFPDPHKIGVWLLMLDRNNNEIWKEMTYDDGDYTCYFEPYCYIFGCTYLWHAYFCDYTPIDNNIPSRPFYLGYPNYSNLIVYDARVCIVIDGVRYGY